jgi:hypothetical protein
MAILERVRYQVDPGRSNPAEGAENSITLIILDRFKMFLLENNMADKITSLTFSRECDEIRNQWKSCFGGKHRNELQQLINARYHQRVSRINTSINRDLDPETSGENIPPFDIDKLIELITGDQSVLPYTSG